jgi:hypothetical protein
MLSAAAAGRLERPIGAGIERELGVSRADEGGRPISFLKGARLVGEFRTEY